MMRFFLAVRKGSVCLKRSEARPIRSDIWKMREEGKRNEGYCDSDLLDNRYFPVFCQKHIFNDASKRIEAKLGDR